MTFFLSPHQDDELITLGIPIMRELERIGADRVFVQIFTDGSRSCVRGILDDGNDCHIHSGVHNYNLDYQQFSDARDLEFLESCISLGVRPSHIRFSNPRIVDGQLSADAAKRAAEAILREFSGAKICTISPFGGVDQHKDHRALGQAVCELRDLGKVADAEFYVEPYCVEGFGPRAGELEKVLPTKEQGEKLRKALEAYCRWEPESGRYAIGYHSVTDEFDAYMESVCAFRHRM